MGHTLGGDDLSGAGSNAMNQVGFINYSATQTTDITLPGGIDAGTSINFLINKFGGGITNPLTL